MRTPDAGQVRRVLTNAFKVWSHNSKLNFREVYSKNADLQIMFARGNHNDGYKFDGPGLVLAHAFYPGPGRGGDVHFDADETWSLNDDLNDRGTKLMDVAVHEIGHALGLGHSSVKGAVMFAWYHSFSTEDNQLPEDDRLAIQELYGARTPVWGVYNPPARTAPPPTTTTTTTMRPLIYTNYHTRKYNINAICNDPRFYYDVRCRRPPTTTTTSTTTTTTTTTRRPTQPRTFYPRHRPHNPVHVPTRRPKEKPDQCNMTYDAITIIRGELYIFKNEYFWRFNSQGLIEGFPFETKRLWKSLPHDFTHVDAVFENDRQKIVFFIGRQYYVFHSDQLEPGYPRPITDLGIHSNINKIDAAFIWGVQNKTYLLSGNTYWVIDKDTGRVELDYPREASFFRGVSMPVDSAFRDRNGILYFFKNRKYWEFNDKKLRIAHFKGRSSAARWMKCHMSNEIDGKSENDIDREVVTLRSRNDPTRRYYYPIEHTTFETLVSKAGISTIRGNYQHLHQLIIHSLSLGVITMILAKYSLQYHL